MRRTASSELTAQSSYSTGIRSESVALVTLLPLPPPPQGEKAKSNSIGQRGILLRVHDNGTAVVKALAAYNIMKVPESGSKGTGAESDSCFSSEAAATSATGAAAVGTGASAAAAPDAAGDLRRDRETTDGSESTGSEYRNNLADTRP